MGAIFSSPADEVPEPFEVARDEAVQQKLSALLCNMSSFSETHASTTTTSSSAANDRKSGVEFVSAARILQLANIEKADMLTSSQWRQLKVKVDAVNYDKSTEREGVHPRLKCILENLNISAKYRLLYDGTYVDDCCTVKKPDFSVVSSDNLHAQIFHISLCLTNLEAKVGGLIKESISQALGYTMQCLIKLVQLLGQDIFKREVGAVCFGSDGLVLAIGFITIKCGVVKIYSTGNTPLPLWGDISGFE